MNLREVEQGTGSKVKMDYIPILCQHCENPVCAEGAPEGAVYTRPDGIVILDPVKSKGRKDMVEKCPYGAIYWNEALGVPQKCTLCAHMLDAGEKTVRCVESCPTQALHFGDVNDPNSDISKYLAAKKGHVEI
jgi:Fe-S-cluster-containing dehydrogenase component